MKSLWNEKSWFVFDWDGTLFNSMHIKSSNFSLVAAKIITIEGKIANEVARKRVIELYDEFSGLPRRTLFEIFLNEFNICPTNNLYHIFTKELTRKNITDLKNEALFSDAAHFLQELMKRNVPHFISSSAPEEEIYEIASHILKDTYKFDEILGSKAQFHKGPEHIHYLKNKYKIRDKSEIIFFGDNIEDWNLSVKAGIDCIIINRGKKPLNNDIKSVYDFDELLSGE